jgi:hypothetical protein
MKSRSKTPPVFLSFRCAQVAAFPLLALPKKLRMHNKEFLERAQQVTVERELAAQQERRREQGLSLSIDKRGEQRG